MAEGESRPNLSLKDRLRQAWRKFNYLRTGDIKYRINILPPTPPRAGTVEQIPRNPLVTIVENVHAADEFIKAIRNPKYYQPYPTEGGYIMKSNELGLEINPSTGFFYVYSVLGAAFHRYALPLAMYISGAHARLVVGPPKVEAGSGVARVPVYDPMTGGVTDIEHPQSIPLNSRLITNHLAEVDLNAGKYDLTYFNDHSLRRYRDSFLLSGKFSALQRDYKNCVPYCLFVGAMLNALKPGETTFKNVGIPRFQQDFGVRILTREEMTRVRPTY